VRETMKARFLHIALHVASHGAAAGSGAPA
jgi:hypothetical protein